jgi:hypothetical protein
MPSMRFEKAEKLAENYKTWNHTEVALAVKESLALEINNGVIFGFGGLRQNHEGEEVVPPEWEQRFDSPLECFHVFVSMDLEPPAEVIICASKCIGFYLQSGGNQSLDEAFFGRTHSFRNSYAKTKFDQNLGSSYALFDRWQNFSSKATLSKKAEQFLSEVFHDYETDIESFLKGYRRWKANKNR